MKRDRNIRPMIAILALLGAAGLGAAQAADWPAWRGANRDGKSPDTRISRAWPAGGPRLAWTRSGMGSGYASVSVVGDRIFTAGDVDGTSRILALDRATGRPLWSSELGKAGAPGWGGFAGVRGTPTVDEDLVFAIGQYGEIAAYEAATGKEVWRKHFEDDFGGKRPEWGFSESPLVDGDQVVCTPGGAKGALVALDKRTGTLKWQSVAFTDAAQYSSIVKAEIHGKAQYVQLTQESVVGISPATGALLWRAERRGKTAVIPTPVVSGNHVYVTSGYGVGCNLFEISSADGAFSAREVYANKLVKNHHGGVILVDGNIYGHSDGAGWVCQDLLTGEEVWREKEAADKGSCVYAAGLLVLREEKKGDSDIVLIDASPRGYTERGRFKQPDQSGKEAWPHPVIVDGRLYVRDQDLLLCYDVGG
ncbi:MAG: PQQ-like beta-propeller repeat protein [Verrucomicrobiales bacterium]|nr:PQQ-like beta-propeller repeat protein [Verrucomicrobiales bacterium]